MSPKSIRVQDEKPPFVCFFVFYLSFTRGSARTRRRRRKKERKWIFPVHVALHHSRTVNIYALLDYTNYKTTERERERNTRDMPRDVSAGRARVEARAPVDEEKDIKYRQQNPEIICAVASQNSPQVNSPKINTDFFWPVECCVKPGESVTRLRDAQV